MKNINDSVDQILNRLGDDLEGLGELISAIKATEDAYLEIPMSKRTREDDDMIQYHRDLIYELRKHYLSGRTIGDVEEGSNSKAYEHFVDIPVEPEELEPIHNYPRFKTTEVGRVFNRRSAFLKIRWGRVDGNPVLRVAITRIGSRGEEDKTLLKLDMPAEPDENGNLKHPRQYVYQVLKQAKREFSAKVGCVICGQPNIWFKKITTPKFPLYQVMFKEIDFADTNNRICRDCEKLINRRQAEFNPVPELDDDGNNFNSIFTDSVSEPYTIRRDLQLDNQDFLAALDVHASNLQLGG